jgi:hypothetical protein
MNRRILINEDERSRILGLHENRRMKEWGMLFEEAVSQIQPSGQATLNYQTAKFADVNACIAETNQPAALVTKFGLNWAETKKKWIDGKCNGTTPCAANDQTGKTNMNLGKALCEGTFGGAAPAAQTTGSASGTTFYIDNKPTVLNTDQEISDMVKSKKITADTFVFKSPEIPKPTKISALPEDSPIKKAVMAIIATVPPDLPGETKTFKISPDGKQPPKDYTEEQLAAAIKDGSLTQNAFVVVTDQATGKSSYQSIMQNADAAKIVNLALGPEALKSEIKSTGNAVLDAWLKTPGGQTYLSKPDRPSQEAFIDYLEQSKDPIVAQVGGKAAMRKILLGDFSADTKLGRTGQKIGGAFKRAGQALMGKDTGINRGYNP